MKIPPLAGRDGARDGAPVVRPGRPEPGPRLRRAVARDALRDGRDGRLHPGLRHRRAALRHPPGHRGRDAGLRVLRPHRDGLAAGRRQRPARGHAPAARVRGDAHEHLQARPARAAHAEPGAVPGGDHLGRWPAARTARGSATRRRSSTARSRRSSTTAQMLDAYLDLGELGRPGDASCRCRSREPRARRRVLGNIALANAEALSSLVIFQLARPGRPIMYGSAVGSMDFRTGAFLAGTPEMGIQSAALTTMGRFYGLPTMGAGCATDAHDIGPGGLHREADHHAAVGLGRGRHRGRVRRAGRRPDAGPGADPRGQRARAPRPAHGRGRGRRARAPSCSRTSRRSGRAATSSRCRRPAGRPAAASSTSRR